MTTRISGALSTSRKTFSIESISRQLVRSAALIYLVLLLPASGNYMSNLSAEAQTSLTTTQEDQTAAEDIQTFSIDGAIGSLVTDLLNPAIRENVSDSLPIYILVGNWSMNVVNGEVNYFQVDFIMGLQDGTQMQVYSIENLENIVIPPPSSSSSSSPAVVPVSSTGQEFSSSLLLTPANNYSLSLFGYVDVLTNDTIIWQNVPLSIDIFNGNTMSILLYPSDTDDRFKGQPIYGIITSILDANNNPIKPSIWTAT
ncbi:MAG TPA: hypothetical protein VKA87_10870 [Nitrososphaeraceae archaeon]|nr:hypothetical protein [Nitrososphaeraceae archaeon]